MKRIVLIGFAILVLAAGTGFAMMGGGQGGMMGGGQGGMMGGGQGGMTGGGQGGMTGGGQRGPIIGGGMVPKEIMMDVMQMMKGMMAIQQDMIQGMIDTEKEQNMIKLSGMIRDLDRMTAALDAAR